MGDSVWASLTEFLPSCTQFRAGFYRIVPIFIKIDQVLLSFTDFYRLDQGLLIFTEFFLVLPSFT